MSKRKKTAPVLQNSKSIWPFAVTSIMLGLLLGCTGLENNLPTTATESFDQDSISDATIAEFTTTSYQEGTRKWDITAKNADIFHSKSRNYLEKVNLVYYDENRNPTTYVVADVAIMETDTQNIQLMTNVTIRNTKGTQVEGDFFYWDDFSELLTSPERVKLIKANGFVVEGVGFQTDKNLENIHFTSQVSGEVNKDRNETDSFFNLE